MDIEKFREELNDLNFSTSKWREKMMMVTKLYKSLGLGLKDITENVEMSEIHSYISETLQNVMRPNQNDFYKFILIKRESENPKEITQKLKDEKILRSIIFNEEKEMPQDKTEDDIFLAEEYRKLGQIALRKITNTEEFRKALAKHLVSKKNTPEFDELRKDIHKGIFSYMNETAEGRRYLEQAMIKEFKEEEKYANNQIRKWLVNRIIKINDLFYKCGALEEMAETNNALMDKIKVPPMKVTMDDKDKSKFNIMQLLNQDYYMQFSTDELYVFAAFYTNRLEKVVEDLNDGIYLHKKLDTLYYSVECDDIPRKITKEDASVVLKQSHFLRELSRGKFKNLKDSVTDDTKVEDLNFTVVPEEFMKKYEKVYREYFDRYIPTKNDFEADYRYTFLNRGIAYCMYALKDFSMESFLYALSENRSKINFGLIKEDRLMKNEYGEEQVLIGVDAKDMLTIRLHFPKKDFDLFVNDFFPDNDFPTYIGNDDFNINGIEVKTPILYKFTKAQRKELKELMNSLDKNTDVYKFVRHMYENMHPNQNPLNKKKKKNDSLDEI